MSVAGGETTAGGERAAKAGLNALFAVATFQGREGNEIWWRIVASSRSSNSSYRQARWKAPGYQAGGCPS